MEINPISGTIKAGAKAIETVAGVFTENAEKGAKRAAEEQKALLMAYQAEFNQRTNRTVVDSIADAFNRLVRPTIVTIIISIFIIAYFDPEHFTAISLAMSSIPAGYWALLSVIIGFYFGGRMQLKSQDFQFKRHQLDAVNALIETKKKFRRIEMDNDEPDRAVGDQIGKSADTEREREQSQNGVIALYKKAISQADEKEQLNKVVSTMRAESDKSHPGMFFAEAMDDV